jgi:hypothetical protein
MPGRTYAENRPDVLPETLGELIGPVAGVIQLPLRLDWSERAEFHLGIPAERNVTYERVIREASRVDDLRSYLNDEVLCHVFGRAEVRDYVDVDAIAASGRYTEDELLGLAADHDPGFSPPRFAEALVAIDRLPDSLFRPYGLSPGDTAALRERMRAWAARITGR